jgi:hypothetical protein
MQEKIKIRNGIKHQCPSGQHEHLVRQQKARNEYGLRVIDERLFYLRGLLASFSSANSFSTAISMKCLRDVYLESFPTDLSISASVPMRWKLIRYDSDLDITRYLPSTLEIIVFRVNIESYAMFQKFVSCIVMVGCQTAFSRIVEKWIGLIKLICNFQLGNAYDAGKKICKCRFHLSISYVVSGLHCSINNLYRRYIKVKYKINNLLTEPNESQQTAVGFTLLLPNY